MGFSIKDLVQQGPRRSTPQMDNPSQEPRTPLPPKKAVQGHVGLNSATGQGEAYQKALYPSLSAADHRSVQVSA
jgi:hypothetical protein